MVVFLLVSLETHPKKGTLNTNAHPCDTTAEMTFYTDTAKFSSVACASQRMVRAAGHVVLDPRDCIHPA